MSNATHNLSQDVMREIFLLTNHLEDRWHISQVCRPWRDVALCQSILWSVVSLDDTMDMAPACLEAHLELLLARSGSQLLDILASSTTNGCFQTLIAPAIRQLAPKSQRWGNFRVVIHSVEELALLWEELAPYSFSALWQLQILVISGLGFPPIIDLTHSRFPKLQKVILMANIRFQGIPHASLKVFCGVPAPLMSSGELRLCSELQELHISAIDYGAMKKSLPEPIHLPKLRKLHFLQVHPELVSDMCNSLTLPMLENLLLRQDYQAPIAPVVDLCRRAAPPLKRLWMKNRIQPRLLNNPGLSDLLQTTPSLQELHCHLPHPPALDDLLSCLANTSTLPQLTYVDFDIWSCCGSQLAELSQLGYSRCEADATNRIRQFHLKFTAVVDCTDYLMHSEPKMSNDGVVQLRELTGRLESEWKKFIDERKGLGKETEVMQLVRRVHRLDNVLKQVMAGDLNVQQLYGSGIHWTLYDILQIRHSYLNHDVCQPILEIVRQILQSWSGRLIDDVPNRHWVLLRKDSTLSYLPQDDPLRSTPLALKLIFGLEESDSDIAYILDPSEG